MELLGDAAVGLPRDHQAQHLAVVSVRARDLSRNTLAEETTWSFKVRR